MKKTCTISWKEFTITESDLVFYEKMWVPVPSLCPEERQRRRQSFVNLTNLYSREDWSGTKKIISPFSADKKVNVIPFDIWMPDEANALECWKNYNVLQWFFEQFNGLQKIAPRWDRVTYNCENSDWALNTANAKNTYLAIGCDWVENIYYSSDIYDSSDISDSEYCSKDELWYELIEVRGSKNSAWCYASQDLYNCLFCSHCKWSNNCIACHDIKNKNFYIFNKPVWEKKFKKIKSEILNKRNILTTLKQKYFRNISSYKNNFIHQSENCSWDKIYNSKNALECFLVKKFEDVKFWEMWSWVINCYDNLRGTENENCYETASNYRIFNSLFVFNSVELNNCIYCETCWDCKNCFGCVGLKNAQYCILNKQYSKKEYIQLKENIIENMKKRGEWWEFFPIENSPYCYNETLAQHSFQLNKQEILSKWYNYKEIESDARYIWNKTIIPEDIKKTPDSILQEILECSSCSKSYRLVAAELSLYRKLGIPIPKNCPKCRQEKRREIIWTMKFN